MKTTLLTALILAGCGRTHPIDQPDRLLSQQPTTSCTASAECLANGATAPTCSETIHGGRAISTWDGGRSWRQGNCDTTAGDITTTLIPGFGMCTTRVKRSQAGSTTIHSIDGGHTWLPGACRAPETS